MRTTPVKPFVGARVCRSTRHGWVYGRIEELGDEVARVTWDDNVTSFPRIEQLWVVREGEV